MRYHETSILDVIEIIDTEFSMYVCVYVYVRLLVVRETFKLNLFLPLYLKKDFYI